MRIKVEADKQDNLVIGIEKAEYLGNHTLKIYFTNGEKKVVDFKPFLLKATHPEIKKYLNEELFMCFEIRDGNLNWADYDLIFPVWDLYEGFV